MISVHLSIEFLFQQQSPISDEYLATAQRQARAAPLPPTHLVQLRRLRLLCGLQLGRLLRQERGAEQSGRHGWPQSLRPHRRDQLQVGQLEGPRVHHEADQQAQEAAAEFDGRLQAQLRHHPLQQVSEVDRLPVLAHSDV